MCTARPGRLEQAWYGPKKSDQTLPCLAVYLHGGDFSIENPEFSLMWLTPDIIELKRLTKAWFVDFDQSSLHGCWCPIRGLVHYTIVVQVAIAMCNSRPCKSVGGTNSPRKPWQPSPNPDGTTRAVALASTREVVLHLPSCREGIARRPQCKKQTAPAWTSAMMKSQLSASTTSKG